MGLDQYAYFLHKEDFHDPVGAPKCDKEGYRKATEFAYFRKFYPLDDWMRSLYFAKGGDDEFNCNYVEVTKKDLKRLKEDSKSWDMDEYEEEQLKNFVRDAKDYLKRGYKVMYSNWW